MLKCKCLIYYAQAYRQQVKEALPQPSSKDPVGHRLEPGYWVYWKHQRKRALESPWEGPFWVLLTTDTVAELEGIETRIHISQLNAAHIDTWSWTDTGDHLWIRLRKRSWHWCRLLHPKMMDQDFILQLGVKLLLLFLSFTLALAWKDNTLIHSSSALAKGGNLWNLEQFLISG